MSTQPSSQISEIQKFIEGVSTELFAAGTTAARWTDYLSVGNAKVGMRVINIAAENVSTRYFHTDHLGSVSVITDENGNVVERLSYDAWGKRRFASGADDPTGSITSQSPRGFTGEEQLDAVGLVHLNGRVYDPLLARFTSADTITESPYSTQGWNRYSYVGNDPLAYTDPSGHCFLGCFWQHLGNVVRAIVQIGITVALTAILGPGGVFALSAATAGAIAAFAGAAIVTGLSGGNLGQALRAGLVAGATAFAFFEVGDLTYGPAHASPAFDSSNFNAANYAENVAGHALVGCASSAASGGSCGSGALSGAVTAGAGPLINGQSFGVALAENAVLGGVASVAGGGKFANGAITGAFGYMFNSQAACMMDRSCTIFTGGGGGGGGPNYVAAAGAAIGGGFVALGDFLNIVFNSNAAPPKPDGIPDDWIEKPTDTPGGTQWVNPDNPNDRVRVMPGNPDSPYPQQQGPYVVDQNGGYRDVNGNPIPGSRPGSTPEAHIPYDDFKFRR